VTPRTGLSLARMFARFSVVAAVSIGVLASAQPAFATPPQAPALKTWGAAGAVKAELIIGNTLYIGGAFTNVVSPDGATTVSRKHLAAIDLTTGALLSWAPTTNGSVEALATDGSKVFVGGSFTTINGSSHLRLGAIDAAGVALPWTVGANDAVLALFVDGSTLYAGGRFTELGGLSRAHLGAVTTSGTTLDWTAPTDERVKAITMAGGAVVAGGFFNTVNGSAQAHIVRLNAATGATLSWTYHSSAEVVGLVTGSDGNVYGAIAGGGGKVRSWTSTGTLRWTVYTDGDVNAVTYYQGQVIAGGHWIYMTNGTVYLPRLAAFDAATGAPDTTWVPKPNKQIWAFATDGNTLAIGGVFTGVSNGTYRRVALYRPA
jgi:hypothetical protein